MHTHTKQITHRLQNVPAPRARALFLVFDEFTCAYLFQISLEIMITYTNLLFDQNLVEILSQTLGKRKEAAFV